MTETCGALASPISFSDAEVLMPCPQEQLLPVSHEPLKPYEFRRRDAATLRQLYGVEPELRPVRLALDVDVRRLVPICRVEEEPIRALAVNRRPKAECTACSLRPTSCSPACGWTASTWPRSPRFSTDYPRSNTMICSNGAPAASVPATVAVSVLPSFDTA